MPVLYRKAFCVTFSVLDVAVEFVDVTSNPPRPVCVVLDMSIALNTSVPTVVLPCTVILALATDPVLALLNSLIPVLLPLNTTSPVIVTTPTEEGAAFLIPIRLFTASKNSRFWSKANVFAILTFAPVVLVIASSAPPIEVLPVTDNVVPIEADVVTLSDDPMLPVDVVLRVVAATELAVRFHFLVALPSARLLAEGSTEFAVSVCVTSSALLMVTASEKLPVDEYKIHRFVVLPRAYVLSKEGR